MDKMDALNAPQWADFDASVRSDIDEYFNVEHEELDAEQLGDLQYHSCPSTPNSKRPISESPYKTPKSDSTRSSQELSSAMKNLQIKEERNSAKGKMSITPRTYLLKKSCAKLTKLSSPRVLNDGPAESKGVEKVEPQLINGGGEKLSEDCPNDIKSKEAIDNSESMDNGEEENADQNCTLVATEESNKSFSTECDPSDNDGRTCAPSKAILTAEDCIAKAVEPKVQEPEGEMVRGVASVSKMSEEINLPPMKLVKAKEVEKVEEPKVKLGKLQERVDPLRQPIANNRKNPRGIPTVLTSYPRRQSTSKYRRVSNKYVPLAEALAKFQNCTPERFRSCNKKDGKGSNAPGPLQKVKRTTLKLTCATSPLLRCKYRSRPVSVTNQEEGKTLKIEEIRNNRMKPNPIKQSIVNCQKKVKTTCTVSETISKLKQTTGNDLMKNLNKKSTTTTGALPLTKTTTKNNGPVLSEKTDEPMTKNRDLSSRRKTTINSSTSGEKTTKDSLSSHKTVTNPPKAGEVTKKLSTMTNPLPSSRRTMMNPPKAAFGKTNESTKNSSALPSSRKTMMNPPKPLARIDKQSTTMPNPFSSKTSMNPPEVVKKFDTELKPLIAGSTSLLDKTCTSSILSTTILSESMRRNTPCKKVVQTVVSTEEGASIKAEEISHCGIPVGNAYKKITEAIPFSFASHNKQHSQMKKDILKNQQDEAEKKTKSFRARPVPSYVIKPSSNISKPPSKPLVTADAPFSFQERDENILKKKKKMFDQMIEREKQNRIFHARPAPKFKPVFVRGASSENLRTNNATEKQTKLSNETKHRSLSEDVIADNRENTEPNVVTTNQPFPKLKKPLSNVNRKFKTIGV